MEVMGTLGIAAVAAASVAFLLRVWVSERLKGAIQAEYDQKLVKMKDALDAKSQANLEILRNDLTLRSRLLEIEKSWVHERTAEAVIEMNDSLYVLREKMGEFVNIFQTEEYRNPSRLQPAREAFQAVGEVIRKKRLFLPVSLVKAIDGFVDSLAQKAGEFQGEVVTGSITDGSHYRWIEIDEFVRHEADALHRNLEDYMRNLIGVREYHPETGEASGDPASAGPSA